MTREFCANCICLVEGDNGEWVCDECQKTVEEVTECPESEDKDMETIQIVEQINTLLNSLKDDVYVNIVDEDGNEADLVLANLEYDNGQINAWCQSTGF